MIYYEHSDFQSSSILAVDHCADKLWLNWCKIMMSICAAADPGAIIQGCCTLDRGSIAYILCRLAAHLPGIARIHLLYWMQAIVLRSAMLQPPSKHRSSFHWP